MDWFRAHYSWIALGVAVLTLGLCGWIVAEGEPNLRGSCAQTLILGVTAALLVLYTGATLQMAGGMAEEARRTTDIIQRLSDLVENSRRSADAAHEQAEAAKLEAKSRTEGTIALTFTGTSTDAMLVGVTNAGQTPVQDVVVRHGDVASPFVATLAAGQQHDLVLGGIPADDFMEGVTTVEFRDAASGDAAVEEQFIFETGRNFKMTAGRRPAQS